MEHRNATTKTERPANGGRARRTHSEKELGRSGTVAGIAGTDLGIDSRRLIRGAPPWRTEHGTRQHNDRDRTAGVDRRRACLPHHSGKEPGRPGTVSDTDLGNDSRLEHGRYSRSPVYPLLDAQQRVEQEPSRTKRHAVAVRGESLSIQSSPSGTSCLVLSCLLTL